MKISSKGLALITDYEKFESKPYNDGFGYMTIGYGHRITDKSPELAKRPQIFEYEAQELLAIDLAWVEAVIKKHVTSPLTQNQFDALCSFVFNLGEPNFKSSTLLRELNAGRYIHAGIQFLVWHYVNGQQSSGVLSRREKERSLFMSGTYIKPVGSVRG